MSEQSPGFGQTGPEHVPDAYPVDSHANASGGHGAPQGPSGGQPQTQYIIAETAGGKKGTSPWMVMLVSILLGSVLLNLSLLTMVGLLAGGSGEWDATASTTSLREGSGDRYVAVLPVYGVIGPETADWIVGGLDWLADDKDVAAVVIHVDSPGGTVPASDQIHHAIEKFKKRHKDVKVVIAQGGMATSGGYYVSTAGDHIIAEPTTWTGNIGVLMMNFVVRKGLEEKLGVEPVIITSSKTPFKDVPSTFRTMEPAEREYVLGLINSAYNQFVQKVVDGRKLTTAEAEALANGKVYTAQQALDNKLIDQVGYLEDALDKAVDLAGLPKDDTTCKLFSPRGISLSNLFMIGGSSPSTESFTPDPAQIVSDLSAPRLMYLSHGRVDVDGWRSQAYPRR